MLTVVEGRTQFSLSRSCVLKSPIILPNLLHNTFFTENVNILKIFLVRTILSKSAFCTASSFELTFVFILSLLSCLFSRLLTLPLFIPLTFHPSFVMSLSVSLSCLSLCLSLPDQTFVDSSKYSTGSSLQGLAFTWSMSLSYLFLQLCWLIPFVFATFGKLKLSFMFHIFLSLSYFFSLHLPSVSSSLLHPLPP